jgi:hypothetical protein
MLLTFWISTLLAYLPFSSASMPMMQMDKMDSHAAHHHAGDNQSAIPCCEMIGTICASLIGYVSEFTSLFFIKGNNRIANVITTSQLIFLDILSPPPKV